MGSPHPWPPIMAQTLAPKVLLPATSTKVCAKCQPLRWLPRTSCRSPCSTCPSPSRTVFCLAQRSTGSRAESTSSTTSCRPVPLLLHLSSVPRHSHACTMARATPDLAQAMQKVEHLIAQNPVVIFSKTYCPYSKRVKDLFRQIGASTDLPPRAAALQPWAVVELDQEPDGPLIQTALAALTGQPTVPHVFIGGKSIGGADSTLALHAQGRLVPMLEEVGALKGDEPSKIG